MSTPTGFKKAGFWLRLLATWVDCLVVYVALKAFFYLLLYLHPAYFPFNFTFFVVGIIYSAFTVALTGQTIGKYLLGIRVFANDGKRLRFGKALLRESFLKIISGIVLFMGFFWIGFSKNKKGWHDYIIRSSVLKIKEQPFAVTVWRFTALVSFLFFLTRYSWNFTSEIIKADKMNVKTASIKLPFMDRNPSEVTEISAVKDTSFVNWLDTNAQTPESYAIEAAAKHPVTLFGEMHEDANNLNFFNEIIPALYHKSGVRVIAMEVIPESMDKKVGLLVNQKKYDTALAMQIARSQCWRMWGFKEYWDVLRTVWELNQSLPHGAEKMKLIGIDADWEMPDLALLGTSQDSKGKTAFWEKFRAFSAVKDLVVSASRDKIMAENIAKEILDTHKKAVVWIGFNHTLLRCTRCLRVNNKIQVLSPRFGVLLSQKYPNTFYQLELYQKLDINEKNTVCNPSIDGFMDSVMQKRNNKPAGFNIAGSPFERLRDDCSMFFQLSPSMCYGDIADGVIFLKPFKDRKECSWMPGYISDEMFMKYKPLYDLVFKQNPKIKFENAAELNNVLIKYLGENN